MNFLDTRSEIAVVIVTVVFVVVFRLNFYYFLGTGGLLMAYALLNKTKETNVCVFEREDRLGGKIFDFSFTQAPGVAVGKPKLILYRHVFHLTIALYLLYSGTVNFLSLR